MQGSRIEGKGGLWTLGLRTWPSPIFLKALAKEGTICNACVAREGRKIGFDFAAPDRPRIEQFAFRVETARPRTLRVRELQLEHSCKGVNLKILSRSLSNNWKICNNVSNITLQSRFTHLVSMFTSPLSLLSPLFSPRSGVCVSAFGLAESRFYTYARGREHTADVIRGRRASSKADHHHAGREGEQKPMKFGCSSCD